MRFSGLPANDPQQEQYQLWIFDASRGEDYPIDAACSTSRQMAKL